MTLLLWDCWVSMVEAMLYELMLSLPEDAYLAFNRAFDAERRRLCPDF